MTWQLLGGCVSAGAGGGAAIPESITAKDNLSHWWRLDEGSTSAATDYGLGAAGDSGLTLSGVSVGTSGGPTAIGSPDFVILDGVTDHMQLKAVDSGSNLTTVGALFNAAGGFSLAFWCRPGGADGTYWSSWDQLYICTTDPSPGGGWQDGLGAYFSGAYRKYWIGRYQDSANDYDYGTGDWEHHVITYPASGVASNLIAYLDGAQCASKSTTSSTTTAFDSLVADLNFCLGAEVDPDGTIRYTSKIDFSDVRIYNKVLSASEAADIAAGDWA